MKLNIEELVMLIDAMQEYKKSAIDEGDPDVNEMAHLIGKLSMMLQVESDLHYAKQGLRFVGGQPK